jgi:two-component system, NtrC family, response regulator AtoC
MGSTDDETDIETRSEAGQSRDVVLMVRLPDRTDAVRLEEGKSIVVGRGENADIVVDHAKASRAHATIRLRAGVLFVEDLGSRNGTRVNDRVIRGESTVLRSGDRVIVGSAEIVASVPESRGEAEDFLEVELAQMLASKRGPVVVIRVAFADPPPDDMLDAIDREVGEDGVVIPRSDCEVFALCAGSGAADARQRIAAIAPAGNLSVARYPDDGRTARELARAAERAAGQGLADRPEIIVADPAMVRVYELVRRIADGPTSVLLLGETGVGKELIAEAIHRSGPRRQGPLVKLNCGALPETLLESELFGHERGAFTGADRAKVGLFEAASGGTIFLDEIGEMTLGAQVRLLRVLETRTVTRIGSVTEIPVDVRVVAATHRDLPEAIQKQAFRQDLYYRIATSVIRIPPLRERPHEIALLARAFLDAAATRAGKESPLLMPEVQTMLRKHAWPGNVRELKNAMEHALVMSGGGAIGIDALPETVAGGRRAPDPGPVRERVADAEKRAILEALAKTKGNRTHAAELLGVSRRTLVYKLARYAIR